MTGDVGPSALGVVVVTRDEGPELRATVERLLDGIPDDADFVVVDDHSTDGSADFLADHERVRLLRPTERLGVARARNHGAAACRGETIVFSDAHVRPGRGWVEPLLETLADPAVGAAAPVMTPMDDPHARVAGLTFVDSALNVAWLPADSAEPAAVPLLCGCFMGMRRDAFEATGGFDPGMSYYGSEDLELSLRLWRLGYRCMVAPGAEIAHRFRVPAAEEVDWEAFLHNLLRMATVHLEPRDLASVVESARARPAFPRAAAAVAGGDAGARRVLVAAAAERPAEWFFERFGIRAFDGGATRNGSASRNGSAGRRYRGANREAWALWARTGSTSSRPVEDEDFEQAREWLDPNGWIPWDEVTDVLCLGAGGGQQAPLFASLGCRVTLLDLSPDQLALDRRVARERGLELEIVEGDMLDLAGFGGRAFDLVFQPVSACYIPRVWPLYRQVLNLLRPGGLYDVEHWNPVSMQLWRLGEWDGRSYRLTKPQRSGVPVRWDVAAELGAAEAVDSIHYIHPLGNLVGGLCATGFTIIGFAERTRGDTDAPPGTEEHRAAFAPPYLRVLARKPPKATP